MLTWACGDSSAPVDRALENGVLIIANGAEPTTLDPHLTVGQPEANIMSALSEGLVVQDPDDYGAVRPGVAKSWRHSDDFRHWTFELRKDARWSNGQPLTADDFVYSFRRMLSPNLESEAADLLHVISGAADYSEGRIADFEQVGIAAPGPHRLEITLEYPAPYLLSMLAGSAFFPVNRAAVEAGGAYDDAANRWASVGTYVGNGPFLLSEWRANQFVLLERNPQYWDAANVALNAVRFLPLVKQEEELQAFLDGKVHATTSIPAAGLAEARQKRPEAIVNEEMLGVDMYEFNTRQRPFDDVRVRRALAMALDREALVRETGDDRKAVAGFVPPGIPGYATVPVPAPDVAGARRLLAEAGYPGGKGFPGTTILVNDFEPHRDMAARVSAMWQRNLGITVDVQAMSWKNYLQATADRQFQIARTGWLAGYLDPGAFLDILKSNGFRRETGWVDPAYDATIEMARGMTDRAQRMATMRRAEDLMLAQQPVIPLSNYSTTYLLDPRVKGWGRSIDGNRVYKFMSFASN
ncbi:peptide ABC transporter substrate-binding protein [Croceicoccus sp. BE223]|uniref:peptide ABC transporter substrate-binding protein n=1 Tax=Croceicoccus sp. BE223 TaxID=2817716 RepID=UPI0028676446|nr:peptide ABC transporter substrate-binding protein [Croceicoccus sp. BE223]MDR7101346.1 oligopeptide transport system substrate-binding protein [Croceicoccus sp. BE223]